MIILTSGENVNYYPNDYPHKWRKCKLLTLMIKIGISSEHAQDVQVSRFHIVHLVDVNVLRIQQLQGAVVIEPLEPLERVQEVREDADEGDRDLVDEGGLEGPPPPEHQVVHEEEGHPAHDVILLAAGAHLLVHLHPVDVYEVDENDPRESDAGDGEAREEHALAYGDNVIDKLQLQDPRLDRVYDLLVHVLDLVEDRGGPRHEREAPPVPPRARPACDGRPPAPLVGRVCLQRRGRRRPLRGGGGGGGREGSCI
mmetsp:Transcript_38207/g.120671  ORF Transcript_38207/g.120671 Transcript_38207/m.120671 type:complete len:255 (+) Transcript_38207:447-1211(+)